MVILWFGGKIIINSPSSFAQRPVSLCDVTNMLMSLLHDRVPLPQTHQSGHPPGQHSFCIFSPLKSGTSGDGHFPELEQQSMPDFTQFRLKRQASRTTPPPKQSPNFSQLKFRCLDPSRVTPFPGGVKVHPSMPMSPVSRVRTFLICFHHFLVTWAYGDRTQHHPEVAHVH